MEFAVWKIDQVTDAQLDLWERRLSPEKQQRARRMPLLRRKQMICADALARQMVGSWLGTAQEDIRFSGNENGKPLCDGACFSVSHSGELVACAVSERPVGVDVEQIRPVRPALYQVLTPSEQAYVASGDPAERFWQLWTMKEAWIKCFGGHLGQFRENILQIEGQTVRYAQKGLHFTRPDVESGYAAAVCEKEETV